MAQQNIQIADPYVGPTPIGPGQLLFGRSQEVRDLADLLVARRVVLLHSPSGAGKSSLINAGLIPALERTGGFRILPVMRVNHEPDNEAKAGADGAALNRYIYSALLSLEEERPKDERFPKRALAGMSLATYLARRNKEWGGASPVLMFDQFEEVVTLDPLDMAAKEKFFEGVGRALADRRRWALFVMREDYVGAIEPYLRHLPTGLSVRMRLDLLSVDGAAEAICRPSRVAGRRMPGLTDNFTRAAAGKLTADLRIMQVQLPGGQVEPRPGPYVEPMHLQVVCRRLWRDRPDGVQKVGDEAIRETGAGGLGTVDEALAAYYSETVGTVAERHREPERRIREWFTRRLIVGDRIRTQVMKGAQATEGLPNDAIDDLIKAYLVRQEPRRGLTWYELAHDRLVQPIVQDNKAWFAKHLVLMQRRAAEWETMGQPDSLLLRDTELLDAERWAAEHESEVEEIEKEFLAACRRQRAREQGRDLAEMGWGIILSYGADPAVYNALQALREHRKQGAGPRYREFVNERAYRPGESAQDFVARQDRSNLALSGRLLTQYLLIVGDPEQIPFEFQYGLSLEYVVGRIDFETPGEYARYARSVVLAERDGLALPQQAVFFAPRNPDDAATAWSAAHLIAPITGALTDITQAPPGWQVDQLLAEEATRQHLVGMLGGPEPPALLFLAAHGSQFKPGSSQQRALSGAPVCADWPGPLAWKGEIPPSFLTTGDDVPDDAAPAGMICIFFATDSAGTPAFSSFPKPNSAPERLAERPFTARLPQRLLAHPRGGALAVIGHVDVNFTEQKDVERIPLYTHFEQVVRRLMAGYTVGEASQPLRRRFALLSTQLSERLQALAFGTGQADPAGQIELVALRTAAADARNYVILGDPAAYLPIAQPWQAVRRLTIEDTVKGDMVGIQLGSTGVPGPEVQVPISEPVALERVTVEDAALPKGLALDRLDAGSKELQPREGAVGASVPPAKPARRPVSEDDLVLNGIDVSSGDYYLPPLPPQEVANLAREQGHRLRDGPYRLLRNKAEQAQAVSFAVSAGVDLADLAQAGWGLLLPAKASPEIKEALGALLELRQQQVGNARFRVLDRRGRLSAWRDGSRLPEPPRGRVRPSGPRPPAVLSSTCRRPRANPFCLPARVRPELRSRAAGVRYPR